MRVSIIVTAGLLLLLGLVLMMGCDEDSNVTGVRNNRFSAEEPFSFEITRDQHTRLALIGINGNITITGEATAIAITITGLKRVESESVADATENLERLDVEVNELADQVQVRTVQPQYSGGRNYIVNYTIVLPSDMQVDVANVNGEVNIALIAGTVAVQNVNGAILARDIEGSTRAAVVNGQIEAEVDLPPGGDIALQVTNGNIELEIPPDTSAEFLAWVVNGSISVLDLELTDEIRTSTRVSGILGSGDGDISLQTVNGTIVAFAEVF